jgi:predicted PurR-regulated permease PerM
VTGPRSPTPVSGVLLVGAALLLFGALLWGVLPILNPFLLFVALASVLYPLRGETPVRALLAGSGGLALFWVLAELGGLLAPFVLAIGIAYLLNPWVTAIAARSRLEARGWEPGTVRSLAVLVLLLPVLGLLAGGAIWGGPWLAAETATLAARLPATLNRIEELLIAWESRLLGLPIPGLGASDLVSRFQQLDAEAVVAMMEGRQGDLLNWLRSGAVGMGRGVGMALTLLSTLVLTPVIGFYLLRDWDRALAHLARIIPEGRGEGRAESRGRILELVREYDRLLSAYLKGQVSVSLLVGGTTALGLLIAQFPGALILGLIVAIFNIVPYLGVVLSLIPAVAIALGSGSVGSALLTVAVVYGVAQTLESVVFSPRIVGDSTGLHPVWILLAISVSGFFFGFLGLLLAVPLAVGVKLLISEILPRPSSSHV